MKIAELFEDLFSDLQKAKAKKRKDAAEVWLVRLKKDGAESRMHDAKSHFSDEDAAIRQHNNMVALNKGQDIKHRLYSKGLGGKVITALLDNGTVKHESKRTTS